MPLFRFGPPSAKRLTPDDPGRLAHLMIFWVTLTLGVFALVAVFAEHRPLSDTLIALPCLLGVTYAQRKLSVGVFADDMTLYLSQGTLPVMLPLRQIRAFTLRQHGTHPQVLWVDLHDGRRYPSPVALGGPPSVGLLTLTTPQWTALSTALARHAPSATLPA